MTLGERLRVAREQQDLKQEEVAGRVGRPLSWYSRIESGRTKNLPEPQEFRRLVAALDVSTVDALTAIGYVDPGDIASATDNPFAPDDPRWDLVEKLKQVDIEAIGAEYTVRVMTQTLDFFLQNEPSMFTSSPKRPQMAIDVSTDQGDDTIK